MGSRANFVLIRDNVATAYYDQWAAMGCIYTFAEGPEIASQAVAEMEPATELMDWAFAEGGYLIDFDRRKAIAFGQPFFEDDEETNEAMGEETASAMRAINDACDQGTRAYLEHIRPFWSGWRIVWDDRGTDALAAHLRECGITTITTQPESHPSATEPSEFLDA